MTFLKWLPLLFFIDFAPSLLLVICFSAWRRNLVAVKWFILAIPSRAGTVLSYLLSPIACLFLDTGGNLKYLRGWLQPSDNPAIGDALWAFEHPIYSPYKLAVTYCWRNPSQGLDQKLKANVIMQTPCKVRGDILSGNYLITCDGYFHLSYKCGYLTGGTGWRLNNIVQGYEHPTMGQIVSTVLRFHK